MPPLDLIVIGSGSADRETALMEAYYGLTEEDAAQQAIDYRIGCSHYQTLQKSECLDESREGVLKMIIDESSHRVLGIEVSGGIADELIDYGARLVDEEETLEGVAGTVHQAPTPHELYRYAAYNGLIKSEG